MELRQLGTTEIQISPIVFGAWAIGGWMWGGNPEKQSLEAIKASIEHGINTIDTAAIYGMGESEKIVGKAIRGIRDKVIIATKCGMRWDSEEGSNPWPQKDNQGKNIIIRLNARANSIIFECEQSLKRLGIDYIDLYQIHWPDQETPPEETWNAMIKLKKSGKVRAIGVSNYDVSMMEELQSIYPIDSNQPRYSLLSRDIEKALVPYCVEKNISVLAYSPLERGLLTGEVGLDRSFAQNDHRSRHPFFTMERRKQIIENLEKLKPLTEKYKASFAQIVINWTIQQKGITAAIVGARNADQAVHNSQALKFRLTPEELQFVRSSFDLLSEQLKKQNA